MADFYDQFVVIPDGCQDCFRVTAQIEGSREQWADIVAWSDNIKPDFFVKQTFMRYLKHGVVPYMRFYFKDESLAALFKLSFAHWPLVS